MMMKSEGYILVIALWIAIVLFIFLTTLTTRIFIQRRQIDLSYHQERALALAESGVDVALACLNEKNLQGSSTVISGSIEEMGNFSVQISSPLSDTITVLSTGYSKKEDKVMAEREVKVTVQSQELNLFNYSVFAYGGSIILDDSFIDSYDSTSGSYEDQAINKDEVSGYTYARSNASVGTTSTDPDAVLLDANSVIFGDISLGLEAEFPQPVPPINFDYDYSGTAEGFLSISGSEVYQLNEPGTYRYDVISISGNGVLEINASVTIYVAGDVRVNDLDITGNGEIRIAPGCTVDFYVGGNLKVAGNGIVNLSSDPSALAIYGTEETTDIQLQGNAAFCGLVYAPQANVTIKGSTPVLYGAVVANSIDIGPHGRIHYDEAIKDKTDFLPPWASIYRIVRWEEE